MAWPRKVFRFEKCPCPSPAVQNTTEKCLCAYISKNAIRCSHDPWISDSSIGLKTSSTFYVRRRGPGLRYLSLCRLFSPSFLQEHEKPSILPKRSHKQDHGLPQNICADKMMSVPRSFPSPGMFQKQGASAHMCQNFVKRLS